MLNSERNTPDMEARVLAAARAILGPCVRKPITIFEHGHWWIEDSETGAQWDVVDAMGTGTVDGFDLEQVTTGGDQA